MPGTKPDLLKRLELEVPFSCSLSSAIKSKSLLIMYSQKLFN